MSRKKIRAALETKLSEVCNLPTLWENITFEKPETGAFKEVFLLFAKPENVAWGDGPRLQRGYMQINLCYPIGNGPGDAEEKADALALAFKRGLSLPFEGGNTIIDQTPEIPKGQVQGDRYVVQLYVRFYADLNGE